MGPLGWWGRFVYRRRWIVLVVSVLTLGVSIGSLLSGGQLRNVEFRDTEAGRASQLIRDEFPPAQGAPAAATSSFILIFTNRDGLAAADPRFIDGMNTALGPLRADPRVVSIATPDGVPAASAAALRSKDGKRALANVTVTGTTTEAEGFFPQLRALVRTDTFDVLATGNIPLNGDINAAENYAARNRTLLAEARRWPNFQIYGTNWQATVEDGSARVAESRGRYADADSEIVRGASHLPRPR